MGQMGHKLKLMRENPWSVKVTVPPRDSHMKTNNPLGHALARGELNCDMMGLDVEAAMAQPRAASLLTAPQQTLRGSMVGLGASVASGVRGIKAGAVCMEFKRGATFDVGGAPKNILLVTCLLNTLLVATKLSLRFSEPTSRIDAQSLPGLHRQNSSFRHRAKMLLELLYQVPLIALPHFRPKV